MSSKISIKIFLNLNQILHCQNYLQKDCRILMIFISYSRKTDENVINERKSAFSELMKFCIERKVGISFFAEFL
jgi:hypothetical protein